MTWAEFEEKEYEIAVAVELGLDGHVFAAGQVLEKVVGYDAAAAPDSAHVIWRILEAPRPRGVTLIPRFWPQSNLSLSTRLPRTPVMLILQFKRPEYLRGATAGQWSLWGEPYFRFAPHASQQKVLRRLECLTEGTAFVRYAAPAFWRRGELESAQLKRAVLEKSGFVSPSVLTGHRYWTYLVPGTEGRANPSGQYARFETVSDLFTRWEQGLEQSTALVAAESLGERLERVAATIAPRAVLREVARWQRDLVSRVGIDPPTARVVGAFATITTTLGLVGATWMMISTPSPRQ